MVKRKNIDVDKLVRDEFSSRIAQWTGDEKDQELLYSINAIGLVQDVVVRPREDKYGVVAGWRRVITMKQTGKSEVPCKVLDLDDLEALKMSMGENLGRKDLSKAEMTRVINTWYHMIENVENIKEPYKNDPQAVETLAKAIYGRVTENSRKLIIQHLRLSRLPNSLQLLLKQPEERTPEEVRLLEDAGIDPSYTLNYETLDTLGAIAKSLGLDDTETADQATQQTLSLIPQLRLVGKDISKQTAVLREFGKKLEEGMSYNLALEELKEELGPGIQELINITFKITPEYSMWHKRFREEKHEKSNAKLVQGVYFDHLKNVAKKRGWT